MKPVKFELNGETFHLLLTGAALFDIYDEFGSREDLLDRIGGTTRQSFDDTIWILVKLAQQGELYRRHMGEDKLPMLDPQTALRTMGPMDVVRARAAIRRAYAIGFERETASEDEEIDLGLLELQKKTALALRVRNGLSAARSFCGFRPRKP